MIECFSSRRGELGLEYLKRAAEKGHIEATYVYGIILLTKGGQSSQEGLKLLVNNPRLESQKIRDCRAKINDIISTMWIDNSIVQGQVQQLHRDREDDDEKARRRKENPRKCGLEDKLTVICEDALKAEFPDFDLVVANIPYGISSPLVAKLVFGAKPFRSATLLLQKEFAKRLLANPGDSDFNRFAVNVKLVAEVEFIMNVSKRDFVPCPKVDSSVVKIHPKANIPDVYLDEWWAFTRTCFSKKNKTLGATFKQKKKVIELLKLSEVYTGYGEESVKTDTCDSSDDGDEGDCLETGVVEDLQVESKEDTPVEWVSYWKPNITVNLVDNFTKSLPLVIFAI